VSKTSIILEILYNQFFYENSYSIRKQRNSLKNVYQLSELILKIAVVKCLSTNSEKCHSENVYQLVLKMSIN